MRYFQEQKKETVLIPHLKRKTKKPQKTRAISKLEQQENSIKSTTTGSLNLTFKTFYDKKIISFIPWQGEDIQSEPQFQ